MKKKCLLPILAISGLLCLTSCALFNDDDMAYSNVYHPCIDEPEPIPPGSIVAGGVIGKESADVSNTMVFKNIGYADENDMIANTYGVTDAHYMGYNVNQGLDYEQSTVTRNNYDLYVPDSASRTGKHVVILFIHGGAWVTGFKTDVNPYIFEFASRGYITATIKYTLLHRAMDDPSLSIFRNLDEIDACISSIKTVLEELNFDTSKSQLVIGGASSGAHLAMLYGYSRGKEAALPLKFIVDAVGPVDIKPETWASFIDDSSTVLSGGLTKTAIAAQEADSNIAELEIAGEGGKKWTDYQTFRIANGMCGLPYTVEEVKAAADSSEDYIAHPDNPAYVNLTATDGGEDQLSVTYWINKADEGSKFPIICAYAGKDTVIGIKQFAALQTALDNKGINYTNADTGAKYVYFQNSKHTELTPSVDPTHYNELIDWVSSWCANLLS